jgi:HSP20 family molecular chaperone IbpA
MTQCITNTSSNCVSPSTTKENAEQYINLTPLVDVYENDKEVLVLADLPGVTAEDLKVELDHPELSIEANTSGPSGNKLRYQRSFRVGSSIDPGRITAELKNGTLEVHLTKSEAFRSRKIEIAAS